MDQTHFIKMVLNWKHSKRDRKECQGKGEDDQGVGDNELEETVIG